MTFDRHGETIPLRDIIVISICDYPHRGPVISCTLIPHPQVILNCTCSREETSLLSHLEDDTSSLLSLIHKGFLEEVSITYDL
jgi:hypothetical protein